MHRELLYYILLIIPLFKDCLMNELGFHNLCSINHTLDINMNELLNITSDSDRFQNKLTISKEGSLVIWRVPQKTLINNTKYQKNLSIPVQKDLKLVMKLFRAEIYVDIYNNEPTLLEICGTTDPSTLLGVDPTGNITENCMPFFYETIGDNNSLSRIHFSQRYNDTLRMLEDYDQFMVQTSPWPYFRYYISRLIFKYNPKGKFSTFLPTMNVILRDCNTSSKESVYLKTKPDRNNYYDKLIYIRYNKLCVCIPVKGNYFIIYNMNISIGNLDLRIERPYYNPLQFVIYADYTAVYRYSRSDRLQVYSVFNVNFHTISVAYGVEGSAITLQNKFWLNMSQVPYRHCSLSLYSFVDDKVEYLQLISGERFELLQTSNGVSGFIHSGFTDNSIIDYPGYLIKEAKCATSRVDVEMIFNTSSTPRFQIHRILQRC